MWRLTWFRISIIFATAASLKSVSNFFYLLFCGNGNVVVVVVGKWWLLLIVKINNYILPVNPCGPCIYDSSANISPVTCVPYFGLPQLLQFPGNTWIKKNSVNINICKCNICAHKYIIHSIDKVWDLKKKRFWEKTLYLLQEVWFLQSPMQIQQNS